MTTSSASPWGSSAPPLVSFLVGSVLLKLDRSEDDGDLSHATAAMEDMKGKKSVASERPRRVGVRRSHHPIKDIVFACDAGMGSSAMGASVLRRKIHEAGYGDVAVVNRAISSLGPTTTWSSPTRT